MLSPQERQRLLARLHDAEAHPRAVLAICVAGIAVVVGLGLAAWFAPEAAPLPEQTAQEMKRAASEQHRREVFEGRRAYYEAGQRAPGPQRAAVR